MSSLPGAAVWLALAVFLLGWLAVTLRSRKLPGVVELMHWWLQSWLGRLVLLALWAEAGFHVFTQHP